MQDSNGKENSNTESKGQKKNYRRRYHNNRNRFNNKNKTRESKDKEIIDKIVGEAAVPAPVNQGQMSRQNPVLRQNNISKQVRVDNPKSSTLNLNKQTVSVVIPLLNEEESLKELSQKLEAVLGEINCSYEVVFVDDGSTDKSFDKIRDIHSANSRFKCIKFRKNYGKSAALAAGFKAAKGNYVITMDADLQDDPNEIPELIKTLQSGYDLVSGWKKVRYDPFIKRNTSKIFNYVTSKLSGVRLHDFNCGLKAYKKDVVKSLKVYGEMHRYLPALAHLSGFKVTEKIVKHHPRKFGKTKFGANRFVNGFLDVITVVFTNKYMKKPLHLFGMLGLLSFLSGFLITLYLTYLKFFEGASISNRPLFLVGILFIIIGVQFISLGLIAEMITKANAHEEDFLIEKTI
ncbi:MAG: glycosyltransferase family 2 protein [Ignavibacteriota bacterium]|nr:glycosyltransferase family 2 protein [Ignavibacteriota bacterium]